MAPLNGLSAEQTSTPGLKLKNTFIHVDAPDDDFGDESEWLVRRQVSAPAPKIRQLSHQKHGRNSLESFTEHQAEGQWQCSEQQNSYSGEAPHSWASEGSLDMMSVGQEMKRQISESSQICRQTSASSQIAIERQITPTFACGFDRQETEQHWPSYLFPREILEEQFPGQIDANSFQQSPSSSSDKDSNESSIFPADTDSQENDCSKTQGQPTDAFGNSQNGSTMPMHPLMMQQLMMQQMLAAGMNRMMYAGMMNGVGESTDYSQPEPPKNRRKANSLITKAQEAKKQQAMMQQQAMAQQFMLQQQLMLQNCMNMNAGAMATNMPDAGLVKVAAGAPAKSAADDVAPKKDLTPESTNTPATLQDEGEPKTKKFCPQCGGGVLRHHKFCQLCGNNVQNIWEM